MSAHRAWLREGVARRDQDLAAIRADADWREHGVLLRSVPRAGPVRATTLPAAAELGTPTRR